MSNEIFSYEGYKPLDFSQLYTEERMAAVIAIIIALETEIPGLLDSVLTHVSLADGGFKFRSVTTRGEIAQQSQEEFLETILDLV